MSIIMTTHFPDHAFLCASKVGLITRDWVRFGDPDDVVTEQSLGETYGVDVRIVKEHTCDCGTLKGCIPVVEFVADRAGAPETAPGAAGESCQGAGGPPSRTTDAGASARAAVGCVRREPATGQANEAEKRQEGGKRRASARTIETAGREPSKNDDPKTDHGRKKAS